jgi:hypothetical protein
VAAVGADQVDGLGDLLAEAGPLAGHHPGHVQLQQLGRVVQAPPLQPAAGRLVWATKQPSGLPVPGPARPGRRISSSRRWAAGGRPRRGRRARRGSRRLSVTASRPHGPGCSSSTQPRTTEAVPYSGSARARDRVAQGSASANGRRLAAAPRGPAAGQHQPARPVQVPGQVGRGAAAGLQEPAHGRLQAAGMVRVRSPSSSSSRSPLAPQPPGGPGPDPDLAVVASSSRLRGRAAAPGAGGPVGPEPVDGPLGDPAEVDLVEEAAQLGHPLARAASRAAGSSANPTGSPSRNQVSSVAWSSTSRSRSFQL